VDRRVIRRAAASATALALASGLASGAELQAQVTAPRAAAGLTFAIDTVGETGPSARLLTPIAGVVVFAAGRGRLDVVAKRGGPALAVGGIRIDGPLAAPGDYYLFDSTGYVLVRPATKTFLRFDVADAAYNYEEKRDGWPDAFEFRMLRPDTLTGGSTARSSLAEHGEAPIFWHLDLVPPAAPVRILARGRLRIADAPAGEVSVARWFGAAQALAALPGGLGAVTPERLRVTSVAALRSPGEGAAPLNIVTLYPLSGLAAAEVDLSRLVVPAGFRETLWAPGQAPSLPGTGTKWTTPPQPRP
jgi:hypothetical protein